MKLALAITVVHSCAPALPELKASPARPAPVCKAAHLRHGAPKMVVRLHSSIPHSAQPSDGAHFDSRIKHLRVVRQCPPLLSFIPVLLLFMDLQRLHDESPESHLTDTWFRSLVDIFGLNATSGTLVAVVRYRLVTYNHPRVS